jgi:hypothetical protein
MRLRVLVLVMALLGIGLYAGETVLAETAVVSVAEFAVPAGETAAVKDGYALLGSLLTLFENLPAEKKVPDGEKKVSFSGLAEVDNRLAQLVRDAKASFEASLIDKIFFNRYRRMLTLYKMVITPVIKNELLENPFMKAFEEFVWDTTYERWNWDDKDSIAKMAAAMEEEFVQMNIYLDTRQKRAELKQKIGKRMLPPPPPPPAKKKPEVNKPE